MKRNPRHRLLAALLTFVSLIVGAMLPISVASAASSNCPTSSDGDFTSSECILVISAPESVPAGQVFTVLVAVTTDGFTVAKSDPCASKVLVTLEVDGPSPIEGSPPFLSSQSVNAKAGIATFSVSVQDPGAYQLVARAGVGDAAPTTANCGSYFYQSDTANFMAVHVASGQPIAPCPADVSCTQVTSGSGSAATLFAESDGRFDARFIAFVAAAGCSNLTPADPGNSVLSFNLIGTPASKTVIFALSSSLITNGIGQYNICWNSPNAFTPLGGGDPVNVGLLPNCNNNDVGPCVLFRTSGQNNVGFFGILAPPGDPLAYPGL
jgi:hypothetical protein